MARLKGTTRRACRLARVGTEGAQWYNELSGELQRLYGDNANTFAAILAVTSPNATVKANVSLAYKAWQQWQADEPFTGFLSIVCTSLELLRASANAFGEVSPSVIRGTKIKHFFRAIVGDPQAVPVDRWMLRAFGFEFPTVARFRYIIDYVQKNAARFGMTPRELQAAIWCGIKVESPGGLGERDDMLAVLRGKRAQLSLAI